MREEKRRKTRNRGCLLFTGNGGFSVIENQRNTLSDPLESVYVLSYSIKDILSSNGLPTLLKFKNIFRNYKINLSWYLLNVSMFLKTLLGQQSCAYSADSFAYISFIVLFNTEECP